MEVIQIFGRSSSPFTRLPRLFAEELGIAYELLPIYDMTAMDPEAYGGNPALKLPSMRCGSSLVFGAQNICRTLAELSSAPLRIVWPEDLRQALLRNAQELVSHALTAQVQIVFGVLIGKLPADNVFFAKSRAGLEGSLRWLNHNAAGILSALPARDLSVLEASLFCLLDHLTFRETVSLARYATLARFREDFSARPSAQRTRYRFDTPPVG
jgi:glutathione S-transferase